MSVSFAAVAEEELVERICVSMVRDADVEIVGCVSKQANA